MTQEKFIELLELHEEIDELKSKIVELERAKKYNPEMHISKGSGDLIHIIYIDEEKYLSIISDEMRACKERIIELTKKFEAL